MWYVHKIEYYLSHSREWSADTCYMNELKSKWKPWHKRPQKGTPRFLYCILLYCPLKILFLKQKWKFVATLCQASLPVPFFQQHLFMSLCHILQFLKCFNFFCYYCICYGDLWSVALVTADVVEMARKLEPKPKDVTKCLLSPHKTLMNK